MSSLVRLTLENLIHYKSDVLTVDNTVIFNAIESLYKLLEKETYILKVNEFIAINDLYKKVCRELNKEVKYDFSQFCESKLYH